MGHAIRQRGRGFFLASALTLLLLATLAPSALAQDAYVVNFDSANVSVIDTQTNQVVGPPISVGSFPKAIAITPDGQSAYVVNSGSNNVSVIDTQTNQVVGSPISVGKEPSAIAITPDGDTAYVVNLGGANVSVIDTQTNQVVGRRSASAKCRRASRSAPTERLPTSSTKAQETSR